MRQYRLEFFQEYLGERVITEDGFTYHLDPISGEMFIWVDAHSEQEAVDSAFINNRERVFLFRIEEFISGKSVNVLDRRALMALRHTKLMDEGEFKELLGE